ncbi:MAG: ArsR/SmtB family transcription factor [Ignavibacteria bacterium]
MNEFAPADRRNPHDGCLAEMAESLKLLSHPVRLNILCGLAHSEVCVGEISRRTGAPQSVISRHLALLLSHRLVSMRREASRNFYRLRHDGIAQILRTVLICAADAPAGALREPAASASGVMAR